MLVADISGPETPPGAGVLAGSDGAGKTTLAHQLAAGHGLTVIHSGRTPDGVDLIARYRGILAAPGRLVLDRCFVSELVYGPRCHGRSRITLGQAHRAG